MSETNSSLEKWLKSHKKFNSEHTYFYSDVYKIPLNAIFDNLIDSSKGDVPTEVFTFVPTEVREKRGLTCLTCGLHFNDHLEQQTHFKSNHHFFNLKRKIKGEPPVSLEAFQQSYQGEADVKEDNQNNSDEEGEVAAEEDQPSDDEENEHVFENSLLTTECEGSFKNTYSDAKGSIAKVFNHHSGPQFSLSSLSFSPWQIHFSISFFRRDSLFTRRDWSYAGEMENANLWQSILDQVHYLRSHPIMAVFILRSGKFAGAVFDNSNPKSPLLVHKVLRRYTVRAKAGGSQSSHDNKHSKAKSMGAQLRRYGEKALREDIAGLFSKWSDYLSNCGLILVSTTKRMHSNLFSSADEAMTTEGSNNSLDSPLLHRQDPRVVFVPFVVEKPTLVSTEMIREKCLQVMFTQTPAQPLNTIPEEEDSVQEEQQQQQQQQVVKLDEQQEGEDALQHKLDDSDEELEDCPYTKQIITAVLTLDDVGAKQVVQDVVGKFQAATSSAPSTGEDAEEGVVSFIAKDLTHDGWTLSAALNYPENWDSLSSALHLAAQHDKAATVFTLLLAGANPEQLDSRGRAPFFLATKKETRDSFRKARGILEEVALEGSQSSWNWVKTGIPEALTDEKLAQQKLKEKEKKKRAQQRKKENKEKAEQEAILAIERKKQQEELIKLQMAQLEAEQRTKAGVCAFCSQSLYKRDFYEAIAGAKVCSQECLAKYKRKLAADAALARFGGQK